MQKTNERKNTVKVDHLINTDVGDFLDFVNDKIQSKNNKEWQNKCIHWKDKWPVYQSNYDNNKVNMYEFVKNLSELMNKDSIVVSDAGSSYYVTSQALTFNNNNQRYITSGAQADMGFTLPAAIGVCIASKKSVIGITGDGSFQLNIQELQTIKHYNLPLKLIVWNNNGYLSIRATQNKFFDGRSIGTDSKSGVSFPEVEKIAYAYDLPYVKINNADELKEKLSDVVSRSGPVICEVICPENQEIIPAVSAVKNKDGSMTSKPIEDMYPFLGRDEFSEEMIVNPV
jgi:acetolactate synthase-1/2/3 large subunit